MMPELMTSRGHGGEAECPEHGPVLVYHSEQGDEWEWREHLMCPAEGCGYEVWA